LIERFIHPSSTEERYMGSQMDRPAKIEEVARALGVSITTVSVVLSGRPSTARISEATRVAVKKAAEELGYVPNSTAQNLRRKRTTMLTLIVGGLENPFFTDIAASVRANAVAHGYEVNVIDGLQAEDELHALKQLSNGSSAGVIVASGRHSLREEAISTLQSLVQHGLPAVIMCDRSHAPKIPSVWLDDDLCAYHLTNHLLRLGHRHIGYLTDNWSGVEAGQESVELDRFRGYARALTESGIEIDPVRTVVKTESTLEGGYNAIHQLLARPDFRPTAIFCTCDIMAIGALRGLYEAQVRVPEDIAVVSIDGITLGQFITPALTTMVQPREELGRIATDMLLALIAGEEPVPAEQMLRAELLVRESCGAVAPIHSRTA
jgi:DNA-binding LacI/PurR family transcriptional regulator